ncbi:MAG: FAD-binding oxidoreductase [bacterium]
MIIKTDPSEFQNYLVDASNVRGNCDAVCFPETEDEIVEIIKEANEKKIQVTISGNGTGLTGGRTPNGGIVIATDKLNKVLEINSDEKYALVETGVILEEFQKIVDEKNLLYPPDPTERNCFLGATIATNASGAKSFKYGATRAFVDGLRIVLPDGEVIYLERNKNFVTDSKVVIRSESGKDILIEMPEYKTPDLKNSAGYYNKSGMDIIDLFIGCEGTLGIITQAKLRLIAKPDDVLSSVVFFKEEQNALDFISKARTLTQHKPDESTLIDALGLEFFDEKSLRFLSTDFPNIPLYAKAAVWFEQEITGDSQETLFEAWIELISEFNGDDENSWFAFNEKEREKFKDFRHSVSYKVNEFISSRNLTKVGTDFAVPHTSFNEFYYYAKSKVEEANINYLAYGHFGDSHIHLNMLPEDKDQFVKAKEIYLHLCERVIELNGTISAEHGIGKLKRDYLLKMYGEENIKKMASIKKSLDPNLILNIGNMIDPVYLK